MGKKKIEGYGLYELEPDVKKMIDNEKKENGIAKDFTVNKAVDFFFSNRFAGIEGYKYSFEPKGRKRVYVYLKKETCKLLEKESADYEINWNCIINESVKFYLKDKEWKNIK